MHQENTLRSRDAGFSVIECLLVMALVGVALGIATGGFRAAVETTQGDADLRITEWQLKLARETAINQRRVVEVRFTPPNAMSVVRHNLPNGETTIAGAVLEHHTQFLQFNGVPDTPDGFGRAAAIDFGAAQAVQFTADGTLTDQAGNLLNGSIFLGQPARPATARALTVFGPTARIRAYRWTGSSWGR